jgi:hypothetical protein
MAAQIIRFEGDIPIFKINSNPNAEASNITTALTSMGLSSTIPYGSRAIDDAGNWYTYVNLGPGVWRRSSNEAF